MIAIITYDHPHRKTQDLIYKLILKGYKDLFLIVLPWVERTLHTPIYEHRPGNPEQVSIEVFCENLHLNYKRAEIKGVDEVLNEFKFEHILIAGAGILPEGLVTHHEIINSHPGYLPNVRGLDALKWAIYNGQPIGVTTHYIDEKPDEGRLIEREIVPVYYEDTFHNVARRLYETEIEMLANAIGIINKKRTIFESLKDRDYKVCKRMPNYIETQMMHRFEVIREKSLSHYEIN